MRTSTGQLALGALLTFLTTLSHLYGATQRYEVGDFTIDVVSQDGLEQVTIHDPWIADKVIWRSVVGEDFLEGYRSQEKVSFGRGSFSFSQRVKDKCRDQRIDDVLPSFDRLEIRGRFDTCEERFSFVIAATDSHRLTIGATVTQEYSAINHTKIRYESDPHEVLLGFGTQYSRLDMKGTKLPIWSQEQGIGRGRQPMSAALNRFGSGAAGYWYTTYTAVPSYVSSTRGGMLVRNQEYMEFDFTASAQTVIDIWSPAIDLVVYAGESPKQTLEAHTKETGRMLPLPTWTQTGAIIRGFGGSDKVRQKVAEIVQTGVPVAAIWIEDWPGERGTFAGNRVRWNWQVDRELYPDFEELVAEIKHQGIRVMSYFNPMLVQEDHDKDQSSYTYAEKNELLVKDPKGRTYTIGLGGFRAAILDLTNPEARQWLKEKMAKHLDLGISGWMADFGETLPYDAVLYNGADPKVFHNQYPHAWVSLNREVIREAGLEHDAIFLSRSGNYQTPGQARTFWIGDQNVTWDHHDGIKTVVPALLSSGLSGYTIETIDVGGWISLSWLPFWGFQRDSELFLRWLEIGVFTSLLRMHDTNEPEKNHQYNSDPETLAAFTRMTNFFAALSTYKQGLMTEANEKGIPLIRHTYLEYPEDPRTLQLDQQFMLGSDLLVAPVLDQGETVATAYLPKGQWVHLWTEKEFEVEDGEQIRIDAPIGYPAVFYRKNSIALWDFLQELKLREVL